MNKVLLVSMPFGSLARPALGISLLKARLFEAGIGCDVRYLTFDFAELIGHEDYEWVSCEVPYTAFAGDWSFAGQLYGDRPDHVEGYVNEVLRCIWALNAASVRRILRIRSLCKQFLDYCLQSVPWQHYALVGFTSTFEQNLASLALAKRVKAKCPSTTIVFGGANWEGEMGQELHRRFPFVDCVCSGEADESFPAVVQRILNRKRLDGSGPVTPGIVYRQDGRSVTTGPAPLVRAMDDLPYPDFSDYFHALAHCTLGGAILPTLLMETSRGCWWGAKSHCTFCGLNGGAMAFRSKSPQRALSELRYLVQRWGLEAVEIVDNILDMRYFKNFLPQLAREAWSAELFYEVKANLSRDQVRLLSEAGVRRIQPGIESLSDHVLQLMRKGTTALRNIQLLKWCKEFNITVDWNILYGFPGERREDYRRMLALLASIGFLAPPGVCAPVRLDRFSPYFTSPREFGIVGVKPMLPYKYLYPFDEPSRRRIAYYFDYDYRPDVDPTGYADEVVRYVAAMHRAPEPGSLTFVVSRDDRMILRDTRRNRVITELNLEGLEKDAYAYCDQLRSSDAVTRHLRETFPEVDVQSAQVRGFLDSMVEHRLMVTDGLSYLSLAIPAVKPTRRRQPFPMAQAPAHTGAPIRREGSHV